MCVFLHEETSRGPRFTSLSFLFLLLPEGPHSHTMHRFPFHYPPISRVPLTAENLNILNYVSVCITTQSFKGTPSFIIPSLRCLVYAFRLESCQMKLKICYLIWPDPSEPYFHGIWDFSFGKPFPDLPDPCSCLLYTSCNTLLDRPL